MFDVYASIARNADFVICTTNATRLDCINYAGCSANRVIKFPMEFDTLTCDEERPTAHSADVDYLLWTTNSTQHKNHANVISGLERYFKKYPESKMEVHMTGVYTHLFLPENPGDPHYKDPYAASIRKIIVNCPNLKQRLKILGNLDDEVYLTKLRNAAGVLHGALYDNGTFSIVEAAWLGVPSISSKYPAIQEVCDNFHIQPALFDPHRPDTLVNALENFEKNLLKFKSSLPSRESLIKRTFSSLAPEYWRKFKSSLDTSRSLGL
jgi:glycosyltransferase involved in cell wall biosynthesis